MKLAVLRNCSVPGLSLSVLALGLLGVVSGCGAANSNPSSGGNTTVAAPAITSINPSSVPAGSASTTLTISGTGFLNSSVVQLAGASEPTTYGSSTQLTVSVPATQLANGSQIPVAVLNGSESSSSTPISLEVDNPSPTITSILPSVEVAGAASAVVTVTGTGFVPSTSINVNGTLRGTTFASATQVSVALSAADLAGAGSLSLTAVNSTPGGGTSPAASLQVNNPTVGTIHLSPSTLNAGASTPATITVTGGTFVPTSVIQVNGSTRATTYVNATTLTFVATVADQATAGALVITVTNPAPGGGISPAVALNVVMPLPTPVISSITPSSVVVGTPTSITISGSGFTAASVAQWNGASLSTSYGYNYTGTGYSYVLTASVPASDVTSTGSASLTVNTPNASPSTSNAVTVAIINPPVPTLTGISPGGGPINTASAESLTGTGFTPNTTVAINGVIIPSTFVSSTSLTATFPAYALATPGIENVTVTTPAPGGGTSAAQAYTTFISTPNNDIVYNPADGLIYASVPATTAGAGGNAVVGIDPNTGSIMRTIQVGTNPNKLALSTDDTQLFVGIDGAGAVAQIDLTQGKVVNQFEIGGGPGVYNAPYTAAYLAAVPGLSNSVAVATTGLVNGAGVTIFDSGIARSGSTVSGIGAGPLNFGSSASTLYLGSGYVDALTVGATGISKSTQLFSPTYSTLNGLQYDNGSLYLSTGQVVNASTGGLNGTFYSTGTTPASGPVVSDSTLGKAFVAVASYSGSGTVDVFDETSFSLLGSLPINDLGTAGYGTSFRKIIRWGQNGLALAAIPSTYTTKNQIYILQSSLVKDVSSSPADLSVALTAPSTATTGTAINYAVKVNDAGPNAASGTTVSLSLDPSLVLNSVTASQGLCSATAPILCDLGSIANGANETISVSATPTKSGTFSATALVSSSSYDPTAPNNQSTGSTTVTGSLYGSVPSITSISPSLVQAGSAAFTLTVSGTGFNSSSTVNLGSTSLTTTYTSATQLTANVTAQQIATYGWAAVTVSNPTPGGGVSSVAPLTIYELVNVPTNSIQFDPYGQSLYATIPSTAAGITANSVVAINPMTGVVGTPVPVGSQPTVMAETSDGKYLYVGLSGADSLAQFNLLTQSLTTTIPISYQSQNAPALSLTAMPGTDTTLAIGLTAFAEQFAIFDVTGSTGAFRSNISGIYEGINPQFASPTELYAYDSETSGAEFYRYSINASGLKLIDGTTLDGMGGFGGGFESANALIYGYDGGIINPGTTPPSQIQTLPLIDFYGSGDIGYGVSSVADPSLQKDFLMLQNGAGTLAYGLIRYDLESYLPETFLTMPASSSGTWTMQRFGQDGLALLSYNSIGGSTPAQQLLLLRGPFVAPQELSTETAASLATAVPGVTHGSGNAMLTLTGSNFLPGVAVTWNGSYRTTTVVDSAHVTVAIPASDLASTGTATLTATNPGAATSNAVQISIN
jgi:hypothetical protein